MSNLNKINHVVSCAPTKYPKRIEIIVQVRHEGPRHVVWAQRHFLPLEVTSLVKWSPSAGKITSLKSWTLLNLAISVQSNMSLLALFFNSDGRSIFCFAIESRSAGRRSWSNVLAGRQRNNLLQSRLQVVSQKCCLTTLYPTHHFTQT